MNADKSSNHHEIIKEIMEDSHRLIEQRDYERAAQDLQRCLLLEPGLERRASILNDLGYACLRLGWFEEAIRVCAEYLKLRPTDNDVRFYLARAYASMKWTDEAIKELRTILRSDPTDILARHDLALCYRGKGWLKESLEEMRKAYAYAVTYGNPEENEVVKTSLKHIEEEIESGDDDSKEIISPLVLLALVTKRSRLKAESYQRIKAKSEMPGCQILYQAQLFQEI